MKRIVLKSILILLLVGISSVAVLLLWGFERRNITVFDTPDELSQKRDTIELIYIRWACDCANWLPASYNDNPDAEARAENCIFIEPASAALAIPDSLYNDFYHKRLRLTGSYYTDKGIARHYEQKTPEKPDHARVFRYDSYAIVKAAL